MAERIRRHRARRGAAWPTIEAPLELPRALASATRDNAAVLVDCLTLWLSNLMAAGRDVESETQSLVERCPLSPHPSSSSPTRSASASCRTTRSARAFRDHAGRLNQAIAAAADRVFFIAAGLPLLLKKEDQ